MRAVRFVALGDSLTEGVGDRVGEHWRGWAALLAPCLAENPGTVQFTNLAVSGAQTHDVLTRQTPAALELRPDLVSVVIGVNDTLRRTFDIRAVAAHLDEVYAAVTRQGATLLTACLPDPGAMLGLPGALACPLARLQRAVNTVVHALSERYGALHLHAADGAWISDRALWSADRLHPGERGHRQLAVRFHALLAEAGHATGQPPSPEPEFPRRPGPRPCCGWPRPAPPGWSGAPRTCCRNCCAWPPTRCITRPAAPAPTSTCTPRPRSRRRWRPCRSARPRTSRLSGSPAAGTHRRSHGRPGRPARRARALGLRR